jgi:hypothetical protein
MREIFARTPLAHLYVRRDRDNPTQTSAISHLTHTQAQGLVATKDDTCGDIRNIKAPWHDLYDNFVNSDERLRKRTPLAPTVLTQMLREQRRRARRSALSTQWLASFTTGSIPT